MKHSRNNAKFSSPTKGVELTFLFKYPWGYTSLCSYTQKMGVSPGNPFSIVRCSLFACTRMGLTLYLLHVSLQGELKRGADLIGEITSEGGTQTQSTRRKRRRLCCTYVPVSSMNTKHRLDCAEFHGRRCCPWIICFSISQHLWNREEQQPGVFGLCGTKTFTVLVWYQLTLQSKHNLDLYAHFSRTDLWL